MTRSVSFNFTHITILILIALLPVSSVQPVSAQSSSTPTGGTSTPNASPTPADIDCESLPIPLWCLDDNNKDDEETPPPTRVSSSTRVGTRIVTIDADENVTIGDRNDPQSQDGSITQYEGFRSGALSIAEQNCDPKDSETDLDLSLPEPGFGWAELPEPPISPGAFHGTYERPRPPATLVDIPQIYNDPSGWAQHHGARYWMDNEGTDIFADTASLAVPLVGPEDFLAMKALGWLGATAPARWLTGKLTQVGTRIGSSRVAKFFRGSADDAVDACDEVAEVVVRTRARQKTKPEPSVRAASNSKSYTDAHLDGSLNPGLDCSEIADDLVSASPGSLRILRIQNESKFGEVKIPELLSGANHGTRSLQDYLYHAVATDGQVVFDPRFSGMPISLVDYLSEIRQLNEGTPVEFIMGQCGESFLDLTQRVGRSTL